MSVSVSRKQGRRALLTTTALVAAGFGLALAPQAASAQEYIDGTREIVGEPLAGEDAATRSDPWNVGGLLVVGLNAAGGELIVRNGGEVSSVNGSIAYLPNSTGSVTVTGDGSLWDSGNQLTVGEFGEGELTIAAGGRVTNTYGYIGGYDGAMGVATVTGAGSLWDSGNQLVVGEFGGGDLTIAEGGRVLSATGWIGNNATGVVTVTGPGSTWDSGDQLTVGVNGEGSLTIAEGGQVTNGAGRIGNGGTGVVTVTGAGSTWINLNSLTVGNHGFNENSLTITDGGVVRMGADGTGTAYVAQTPFDSGVLNIGAAAGQAAAGAGFLEAGGLYLGPNGVLNFNHTDNLAFAPRIQGPGFLNHYAGTTRLTADNILGEISLHGGTLIFEGGASQGAGRPLYVGRYADDVGTLAVQNGASLTSWTSIIGHDADATGYAIVTGAGSLWQITNGLLVGQGGTGRLQIRNGGTVRLGADGNGSIFLGGVNSGVSIEGDAGQAAGVLEAAQVVLAGQALTFNHAQSNYVFAPRITGSGSVTHNAGHTILSGNSTYTGTTWLYGGTLTLGHDNALGVSTLRSYAVVDYADGVTIDNAMLIYSTNARFQVLAGSATQSGRIDQAFAGAFQKIGGGELILTGDNTWTGTIVADGRLTVRGGSISNTSTLTVAGDVSVAEMLVDEGGQVSTGYVTLGGVAGGDLTVSGTGSQLEATTITTSGAATLTVADAATLSVDTNILINAAAMASMVVSGQDSVATGAGLYMGTSDIGVLLVDDNGRIDAVEAYLGMSADSYGQATLMNGGVLNVGEMVVGHQGQGHLQALDGGSIKVTAALGGDGSLVLGGQPDGYGLLEIDNGSASIENTLWIGRGGDGFVSVGQDGVLETGAAHIAEDAASISNTTISGGRWDNTGAFIVSGFGWGTLFVEAGGVLNTGEATLGLGADSMATAVLQDAGTIWTLNGDLIVGDGGEGALQVRDGAIVTGGAGHAGADGSGFGEIWLTDGGALNLDSLDLGQAGEGYLTLTNGGALTLNGGTGVLNLGSTPGGYGVLTIGGVGCGCTPGAPDAAGVLNAAEVVFGPGTSELYFNHTESDYAFGAELTGAGLVSALAGTTRLTADSAGFTGQMLVFGDGARLLVDGQLGGDPLTSLTVVADGGRLGGVGALDQYVVIDTDGVLEGRAGQTLNMANLMLGTDSIVETSLGTPGGGILFDVAGDLTLDGELRISNLGGFGVGLYSLFGYGGVLTDNGLDIASAPAGTNLGDLSLQITGDRINLINSAGLTVTFWDGGNAALYDNGVIDGGDGTWTATAGVWTDDLGLINGVMDPSPGFAVFGGAAGTVTADDVDGALSVAGMQFAVDGYTLTGDAVTLTATPADPIAILRVGDGTAAGAGWTAMIESDLTTTGVVHKTDHGTLILAGDSTFGAQTEVRGGVLAVTGSLTSSGALLVAVDASDVAALTVADGGSLSSSSGFIGVNAGARGAARVTGAGSQWTNSGGLYVGSSGEGELSVLDGGLVESGLPWTSIGANPSGQGVATVFGAGSRWIAGGQFYVGAFGIGELNILNGGLVETNGDIFFIGAHTGSRGEVVVSGAGSALAINELQVGSGAGGSLLVADGASVSGVDAYVGAFVGGVGDLTVTGNSRVGLTEDVVVGAWGAGEATLSDGGVLAAGGEAIIAREVDTVGVLNIGAATGDTAVAAGTLEAGSLVFGAGSGSLVFNHTETAYEFGAAMSGAGRIDILAGTTRLTGDSSAFAGTTTVGGGSLMVDGGLGGAVTVRDGASLGGSGVIGGVTVIEDGAVLSGAQGQTLTLGELILSDGAIVSVGLGAADGSSALFDVAGDLVLDGTLQVTDIGGFGAGVYRLFDYGGDLTDQGLDIDAAATGVSLDDLYVQTSVDSQVNLVSTLDVTLRFWDGAGPTDDGAIQGGGGTWGLGGRGWTGADGAVNGAYDNPAFAVFQGAGGTVTVDGAGIGVTGMQFAVDGYEISGDAITLTEAETIIRVGDGTAAGAAMTATIASALTGPGALVKTDLGNLVLTGANTYAGGTVVRGGTLVGDAGSIAGDVLNDAILVFDQGADAAFGGAISGEGLAIKRGGGVLNLLSANSVDWSVETGGLLAQAGAFTGDVDIASGAAFTLNADADAVFGGVLGGEGTFGKTGAGVLALTGDSSAFEGVTEISEDLLVLNGALGGQLRILDGAMLAGSGVLAELTAGEGSVIAPGNSIGTLSLTGDVVFQAGSIYEVEVDPTSGASDHIVAGGTATLNGGVVRHVGYPGAYGPESTYTILTAAGGVTGAFDGVETDFAFLDARLDYEADAVLMLLERNDIAFPAVGETGNQRAIGAAVEATGSGGVLYDAVIGQTEDGARLAFDMLSGELHGSIRTAQSEAAQVLAGTLSGRMDAARAIETGAAFWAQATGSRTRLASDGEAASLTHGATGLMVGADAGFGALRLGVAAGSAAHDYDSHARAGSAEGTSLSLAAYGSSQWGPLSLKGAVAGTWHEVQTERLAAFPGFAEVLSADYDAETAHAFVEAAWRVDMGAGRTLEPFASLARVRTETDAFAETGGAAALAVQGRVQAANLATIGLGMSRAFDQGAGRAATLSGRIGWRHAWGDIESDGRHAFASAPAPAAAFTIQGLPVAQDALVTELGLDVELKDRLSLTARWSGQHSRDISANALSATVNWRF